MTPGIVNDLVTLIDRFLSGEDHSLALANEIEGILLQNFTLEPWFDEASLALSEYRPGGGNQLLNEGDIAPILRMVRDDLLAGPV